MKLTIPTLLVLIGTLAFAGYKAKLNSLDAVKDAGPGESEPKTLLARVVEWQYPGSRVNGATMSDAGTVNAQGQKTTPSVHCKTVLTTSDPIGKVFDYYKSRLAQNTAPNTRQETTLASGQTSGSSVKFHSDSEGRPLAIHVIMINSYPP